jgi:hypothetical protein
MAIAVIKYDENNCPKRAKFWIVVLGNLDYHQWSKENTYAPVLSQLELQLLTSLAVHHKRVLKNADVKQAFVLANLPEEDTYIVKPPVGCPRSKPGTYWKLIRSLYGLKRAPHLWYDLISSCLEDMGLQCSPTSPCLFKSRDYRNAHPARWCPAQGFYAQRTDAHAWAVEVHLI